ncbi:MAG: hypothetical protein JWR52_1815 [Marmoricola sp.]|nr:hypothetical protein [Marmoricola sp.]
MTGDDTVEPSFDDPSHEAIRALLRDARADEPVPADVVARLDATFAELRGRAPVTDEPLAEVVALRRRVVRLRPLVAAAAVIVVGVGGGGLAVGLANRTTHGPPTSAASASKATIERGPLTTTPTAHTGLNPLAPSPDTLSNPNDLAAQRVAAFTTAGFARQAATFVSTNATYATAGGAAASSGSGSAGTGSGTSASGAPSPPSPYPAAAAPPVATPKAAATCVTPTVAAAEIVPITLDGQPATLVLHPVSGGSQLVEAWSCDGTHVLAHTTVPG